MKPGWQKARFTAHDAFFGREVWIKGPPRQIRGEAGYYADGSSRDYVQPILLQAFESNLIGRNNSVLRVKADVVELLPEFAEAVEPVKIEDWAQQYKESA